jgi:hypothetical protein
MEIITQTVYYGIGKSDKGYFLLNKDGSLYSNQHYETYEEAALMLEAVIAQDCGDYYGQYTD